MEQYSVQWSSMTLSPISWPHYPPALSSHRRVTASAPSLEAVTTWPLFYFLAWAWLRCLSEMCTRHYEALGHNFRCQRGCLWLLDCIQCIMTVHTCNISQECRIFNILNSYLEHWVKDLSERRHWTQTRTWESLSTNSEPDCETCVMCHVSCVMCHMPHMYAIHMSSWPGPGDQGRLRHYQRSRGDPAPAPETSPAANTLLPAHLHDIHALLLYPQSQTRTNSFTITHFSSASKAL